MALAATRAGAHSQAVALRKGALSCHSSLPWQWAKTRWSGWQGRHWAIYPALGWGLGLLLHGAVVWLKLPGGGHRQRVAR
ncbi:hypothetical protein D3C86_2096190 [compost metagenome]